MQKFEVALLDKDCKVIKVVTCITSDSTAETQVPELVGLEQPSGYLINYQGYGYGKFIIDELTLSILADGLKKIEDCVSRK